MNQYKCPKCQKNAEISDSDSDFRFKCEDDVLCGYASRFYLRKDYPSIEEAYGLWAGIKVNKDNFGYDALEKTINSLRGISSIDDLRFDEKPKIKPKSNDEVKKIEEEKSFSTKQIKEYQERKEKFEHEYRNVDFIKKIIKEEKLWLVDTKVIPPSHVEYSDFGDFDINKNLADFLINVKGIEKPYIYQKEAFDAINSGKNVIITAPTASGKTESFIIPIINYFIENPDSNETAFCVYPTKALAGDQYDKFIEYQEKFGINFAKLDGDVKDERMDIINKNPRIIITNMEFIHHQLISNSEFSEKFKNLIENLKFLVIDEVHKHDGYVGSNSIELINRIRRFSERVQIIGASATIENPVGFCKKLFNVEEISHVKGSGERGEIELFLLYPSEDMEIDESEEKISTQKLISEIFVKLIHNNLRTIAFSNSRMGGEEIFINSDIEKKPEGVKCGLHRAGLLKSERDQAEKRFKNGEINGIVSTPTLELGMDIGDIDAVISEFVPLSILEQRIGRAGRRKQNVSYGFMLLNRGDPISRYYLDHPEKYWERMELHLDNTNENIIRIHKIFSAYERSFTEDEINEEPILSQLRDEKIIVPQLNSPSKTKLTNKLDHEILSKYSLRDIGQNVQINLDDGQLIGDWDLPMAFHSLHDSAIYLHNGESYRVKKFDLSYLDNLRCTVSIEPDKDLRTKSVVEKQPVILKNFNEKKSFGIKVTLSNMIIGKRIREYYEFNDKKDSSNLKTIDEFKLGFPTVGIELDFSDIMNYLSQSNLIESDTQSVFHSLEHIIIHCGNMLIGGVYSSLDGITMPYKNKIYIFDQSVNGGNGSSNVVFNMIEKIISKANEIVNNCQCTLGCPLCIYKLGCGDNNMDLNKAGLKSLLKALLSY